MTNEQFHNLVYLQVLLSIEGIGPLKTLSLLAKFQKLQNIFSAGTNELANVDGISQNLSKKIITAKQSIEKIKDKVEIDILKLEKMNANILTFCDDEYPELLKRIYYPPMIIYYIGHFTENDKKSIAVVGTRQPSVYGKMQAEYFASKLAENNLTLVSGLARGIDSIVHHKAINCGGRTIAVIGSGLDVIYPPENKKLFWDITNNGAVITEYELGTKPDAQNFPRRNRIISGLSLGTLIIETKLNGGAMQTAAYAIDQNREVFAVPGNLSSKLSEGPNVLIQRGEAKLVTNSEDILVELKLKLKPQIGKNIPKPSIDLTLFEQKIISVLNEEPKHIDEISSLSLMTISDCLVNLLTLEFKGLVRQLPGKMFNRI